MASIVEVLKELDVPDLSVDKAVAVLADVEDRLRHSTVSTANELNLVRLRKLSIALQVTDKSYISF